MAVSSDSGRVKNYTETAIRRQCSRWIHEYTALTAWKLFLEYDSIGTCTRNIAWGLHQGDLLDQDLLNGQVQLLTLLCTMSATCESWDKWLEEEQMLPLEKGSEIVRELVDDYSMLAEDNAEVAMEIEIQAVLECCRSQHFRLAREVLARLWQRGRGDMSKTTYRILSTIIEQKKMADPYVLEHSYEDFLVLVKKYLSKAFAAMEQPWLIVSARHIVKIMATPAKDAEERKSTRKSRPSHHSSPTPRVIPVRFIVPEDLYLTAEDVEVTRQQNAENKTEDSNQNIVQREMRERLDRRKREKLQRSTSKSADARNRNVNNNASNIMHELDRSVRRLDKMKQQRLDSEMAVINEYLRPGPKPSSTHKRTTSIEEDESDVRPGPKASSSHQRTKSVEEYDSDQDLDASVSSSKRIKPLPRVPRLGSLRIQDGKLRPNTRRMPWTNEETERLRKGVKKLGRGNWTQIKEVYNFSNRTSCNLKDRWRTITKDQNH